MPHYTRETHPPSEGGKTWGTGNKPKRSESNYRLQGKQALISDQGRP